MTYLNGIVHSQRKTGKGFLTTRDVSMCEPWVTRHTSIRYSSSWHKHTHTHTHVNMGASIFVTAAMIRAFRSARSRGNGTLHEMHVAQ